MRIHYNGDELKMRHRATRAYFYKQNQKNFFTFSRQKKTMIRQLDLFS